MENLTDTKETSLFLPNQYQIHWYTIERVLGRGGFGTTYLARDNNLDRPVAIKEYLPLQFCERTAGHTVVAKSGKEGELFRWGLDRFLSEAQTLAKFDHSNIVHVNSVFEYNNTAYMVMKFEEGSDLADFAARKKQLRDQQSLLNLVLPILEGLELVHKEGFIHRDIKPANIYIRSDSSPVLLDFGSARQSVAGQGDSMTRLISKSYTPFEQYNDTYGKQGPWTDIYSLGATLYFCITGELPVDAMVRAVALTDKKHDPYMRLANSSLVGYSQSFLACIDWALAFREKDRPQSSKAWADAFLQSAVVKPESIQTDKTVIHSTNSVTEPSVKPSFKPLQVTPESNSTEQPTTSRTKRRRASKSSSFSLVLVLLVVLSSVLILAVLGYRYLQRERLSGRIVSNPVLVVPQSERVGVDNETSSALQSISPQEESSKLDSELTGLIAKPLALIDRGLIVTPKDNNAISELLQLGNKYPSSSKLSNTIEGAVIAATMQIDQQLLDGEILTAEKNLFALKSFGFKNDDTVRLSSAIESEKKLAAEVIAAKKAAELEASKKRNEVANQLRVTVQKIPPKQVNDPIVVSPEVEPIEVETIEVVQFEKTNVAVSPLEAPVIHSKALFDPVRLAVLRSEQRGQTSQQIIGNKLRNFIRAMNTMDVRYLKSNSVIDDQTRSKIDGLANIYQASEVVVHDVSVSEGSLTTDAKLTIKKLITASGDIMEPGPSIGVYALHIRRIDGVWYDIAW